MLKTSTRSGLASSRVGRYSTPRWLRNKPSEAARLILVLMPHNVATLKRRNAFGHSWGCTGKSFSKTRNRNLGIFGYRHVSCDEMVVRSPGSPQQSYDATKHRRCQTPCAHGLERTKPRLPGRRQIATIARSQSLAGAMSTT